jgi:deoxyribonuclease-4
MLKIGCHLSVSKGFYAMGKEAVSIDANTIQFFTRNPRGGSAKPIDEEDVKKFQELARKHGINNLLAHAPYTLNACAATENIRTFAKNTMEDDLKRMEYFPESMYNFHPGSHVGQGVEQGTDYIVQMLNEIIKPEQTTRVLLETMAGKGSEIGRNFQEIKNIMDRVIVKEHIGVCLDTCHIFDGGYDIVNRLDEVIEEFDKIIGLENLYAIHLNDSMNICGSHKDRHAKIGEGNIGLEAITRIINHPKLRNLPFFLETPNELEGYAKEIKLLREKYKE